MTTAKFFTVSQAAALLDKSAAQIRRHCADGSIPAQSVEGMGYLIDAAVVAKLQANWPWHVGNPEIRTLRSKTLSAKSRKKPPTRRT